MPGIQFFEFDLCYNITIVVWNKKGRKMTKKLTKDEISLIENRAIIINAPFIFIMAVSGLVFGYLSHSSSIILDGLFSTILFLTLFLAMYIKQLSNQPVSYLYPYSKWKLDTIYILFKVLVLLGILFYTFFDAIVILFEYIAMGLVPNEVEGFWITIYSIIKLSAAVPSYFIYQKYRKSCDDRSEFLKIEQKSVLIDAGITLAILLGFYTIGQIELFKEITDAIILLFLAMFLIREMFQEFIHTMNVLIGKRIKVNLEEYYVNFFNLYFSDFHFKDIHIEYYGKITVVSVVCGFDNEKSIVELHDFERIIKEKLSEEFGEVYLHTYWDEDTRPYCMINEIDHNR